MAFYREIILLYLIQWLKTFTAFPKGKSRVNCKSCFFFVIFRIGCRETSEVFKDHSSSLLILSFLRKKDEIQNMGSGDTPSLLWSCIERNNSQRHKRIRDTMNSEGGHKLAINKVWRDKLQRNLQQERGFGHV